MSNHPIVLADRDRARQFALLAQRRNLFSETTWSQDPQGVAWAAASVEGYWFAVSLLGPGWVFDPYARTQRADRYDERLRAMQSLEVGERDRELQNIVSQLRLGPIAQRILWSIHAAVIQARCSVVKISDRRIARLVWGGAQKSKHWRSTIRNVLNGLAWLHIADRLAEGQPVFGQETALLTHAADLRVRPDDRCDASCPDAGGAPHSHFIVNVGRGFLGVLEQFANADHSRGVREYDFKVRGKKGDGPTLRSVGKTGRLVSVYLPAKFGDPLRIQRPSARQLDLLQAIVRETTRNTKTKRSDISEAEAISGNKISGIQRSKTITCDLLQADGRYVGFNGNGCRRGLGYGLTTGGGWLAKAGYDENDVTGFLVDLAALAELLGLIAVGIHFPTRRVFNLEQLQALAQQKNSRQTLRKTHLRIYTAADYLQRWNAIFGWPDDAATLLPAREDPNVELTAAINRKRLNQKTLADAIHLDPSFLSKLLRGQRTWPADKLQEAQRWVAEQGVDQVGDQGGEPDVGETSGAECSAANPSESNLLMPVLAGAALGQCTMLDVALAYLGRGWSVIPQLPGAKQPCVKWKSFQEQRPTPDELTAWFTQWPQAGLAVVLGPVSGLVVVDVDGSDAHAALIEHIGSEPLAPKVLSGSRQPDRYHLFFQCPADPTKAKSTPWHPKLEFRGQGAVVVIPPSLHPSGNRYEWVPEQSIDSLPVPLLPPAILAALKPTTPLAPIAPPAGDVPVGTGSPSTRVFLAGDYAQGPNWNDRLFRAACDLAGRGMRQAEAEPLLLAGAQPWNEAEAENARRTIESAFSAPREPAEQ